ncbi:MAG: GAF domain-containing protein [Bacteroidota bacterium]
MQTDIAENESARLEALDEYRILDTEAEREFDALTKLASFICGTPISLISLVDEKRQWFKSRVGLEAPETPREISFCQYAIRGDGVFEIPNTLEDERFVENPLVTGNPNIRFYAGSPLVNSDGFKLGTLCVIDTIPRELTEEQKKALGTLADEVIARFELRRKETALKEEKNTLEELNNQLQQKNAELADLNAEKNTILAAVTHELKNPVAQIIGLSKLMKDSCENMTEEQCDDIERIYEAGWKANEMIDKLLGAHSIARPRR